MNKEIKLSRIPEYCPYCWSAVTEPVQVNATLACSKGHSWYYEYIPKQGKKVWLREKEPTFSDWEIIADTMEN